MLVPLGVELRLFSDMKAYTWENKLQEFESLCAFSSSKTRRRGAELEKAIIEAAWAELAEHGYSGLTMETVAARAHTSRSVLARRWDGKASLTVAAIQYQLAKRSLDIPDQGSVRQELLTYLDHLSDLVPVLCICLSVSLNEAFRESYPSLDALRLALMGDRAGDMVGPILRRAIERREIDESKLSKPVASLLTDLIRHYALMHRAAPPKALRKAWVDEIFLPLVVRPSCGRGRITRKTNGPSVKKKVTRKPTAR